MKSSKDFLIVWIITCIVSVSIQLHKTGKENDQLLYSLSSQSYLGCIVQEFQCANQILRVTCCDHRYICYLTNDKVEANKLGFTTEEEQTILRSVFFR